MGQELLATLVIQVLSEYLRRSKFKTMLARLTKRKVVRNLCCKGVLKQDVVASSLLSNPNCLRLMKQSGSLVRSSLGTCSATFSPLELPKGRRQKSYTRGQSAWQVPGRGSLGTYVSILPPGAELTQLTGCLEAPQASPEPHQLYRDANLNSIPPTYPQARLHSPSTPAPPISTIFARIIPSHLHLRLVPWFDSDNQDGEN